MSRILLLTLMFGLFAACTNTSKPANDEDRVLTFKDFKEFFPEITAAYRLNADSLKRRIPDTFALKARVVKQFLPDTLAKGTFTAAEKPKFFPRAYTKSEEQQFFVVEGTTKAGNVAWLCIYDKEGKFLQRHLVAKNTTANNTRVGFVLDTRQNLKVTTETQRAPGQLSTREDVYAANPDGSLALIMTNSNEPTSTGLYNPIDTLARKHKFSANYASGEQNLVSIRDGETAKEFLFFIHFSRDNGDCVGEIDGVGRYTTATTGQFRDKNTSCILDFKFSSGKVTIKETGCGAYRGIKCFFEGTFIKKKK
ncbi:hypothetical protein GFS24_18825 [Chitinophaga sp. SYP-B3965]|uniref:hypothetical protein n=1 Tax=Chitinophaga sp. SYP-B3965 TaxID=2663120 RepID=UPI001299AE79|nr:hypothetical protein [Chitinophaga sp. SYP-B3965]MRG47183.1 hypothetical protein [Chitinophaga sp. SYP-B3965]